MLGSQLPGHGVVLLAACLIAFAPASWVAAQITCLHEVCSRQQCICPKTTLIVATGCSHGDDDDGNPTYTCWL